MCTSQGIATRTKISLKSATPPLGPNIEIQSEIVNTKYRSGTVNSKFHFIRSFFEIFATFLLFHV